MNKLTEYQRHDYESQITGKGHSTYEIPAPVAEAVDKLVEVAMRIDDEALASDDWYHQMFAAKAALEEATR